MTAVAIDHHTPVSPPALTAAAGRVLIAAGAVFGSANLFQGAVMGGMIPVHEAALALSWPVAVAVFLITLRRLRRHGGEAAQRVTRWSRLFILSQIAAALTLAGLSVWRGDGSIMMWMSPVGLSLYAVGWGVGAMNSGGRWMAGLAFGTTIAAAALTQLVGTPEQYLAYASALFAFVLIPGLMMAASRKGQADD